MSQDSEPGAGLSTRRVHVSGHAVDVRGTFSPERPPILLVHGIGMSGEYFLPFADVLSQTHDVYAVDLPGYGHAPKPPRALTITELGEVLAEVTLALGLEAAVVVGHSMGAQIVTNSIAGHRELFAGYILIGPTVDPTARSLPRQAARLFRDSLAEPPSSNAVIFRNYLRMGPLRYLRTAQYMVADRIEESIRHCTIPGLVMSGDRDPIASEAWLYELAGIAPHAQVLEVLGGPHAVQLNRPRELAAACAPFLESVTGQQPGPRARFEQS
ncbi:alpha/beta hydrolase [Nesterenkonia sp. Act20]|uniref:alpha/beta fold hydrolase n=1 Tax=Nesterenkonia sp. Act20 TaxID=1483432 RepID=UPI001C468815